MVVVAILGLIGSWILFIYFMVNENNYLIKTNQIVNHLHNAIMTGFMSVLLSLFYVFYFGNQNIIQLTCVWLWLLLGYWLLFDIWLNLKRKLPIQYLGKGAKLDRFLRKYSFGQPIAFKLICGLLLNVVYYGYYSLLIWIFYI